MVIHLKYISTAFNNIRSKLDTLWHSSCGVMNSLWGGKILKLLKQRAVHTDMQENMWARLHDLCTGMGLPFMQPSPKFLHICTYSSLL